MLRLEEIHLNGALLKEKFIEIEGFTRYYPYMDKSCIFTVSDESYNHLDLNFDEFSCYLNTKLTLFLGLIGDHEFLCVISDYTFKFITTILKCNNTREIDTVIAAFVWDQCEFVFEKDVLCNYAIARHTGNSMILSKHRVDFTEQDFEKALLKLSMLGV